MLKKVLISAVCAFGLTTAAQATTLNFGIISTESSTNLKKDWEPVLAEMARQTGYEVKPFFAPDYAGVIEGMRFNKVQVAWFGNKSAMEAVDRADGEIFAQTIAADGSAGYYSLLIVNKKSPINTLDDMLKEGKSLSFSIGDPNSTSGFLVPTYYVFAKNHIDPKTFFKVTRSANHESNAMAVANGQVDVATNNTESLDRLKLVHPAEFDKIKVIWKSPLIPSDPLVYRKDLPQAEKTKIADFFYNYGKTPEQKAALKRLGLAGFKPSTNAQLVPIREISLFTKRTKIEANAQLSAEEKKSQIAKIDEQLAALKK
ncbi:MAG: phosphonate ABC transporter substrate-binding protein [Thiomonas sp.]|uniref:phosphonate ABC transporter substrate-binding protein n=1 Tax=Thiomonas sp. TaxID=2047785 RepID=UPI002A36138E|nr:phosphonate ABC transporter substrate-binding protein [Thiomonas sp.]MDY0329969.1 phosphonate ABC transporter substrate-binding protein [Thiomonas sp.]